MDTKILFKIKKGSVWAIIPARSGSKGVKNKNICEINGYPLIAYSIAAARVSRYIERVIVSTDSENYRMIANKYGAETPFLRPVNISDDRSTDFEFMEHAITWFYNNEDFLPEFWVHLRCTTPLRKVEDIDEAIEEIKKDPHADSLRSAHIESLSPYKWFIDNGTGYFTTLMGNTLDEANNPRQIYPSIYVPDGYVDILRTEYIVKNDLIHGEKMIAFHSPAVVDLDKASDLESIRVQGQGYKGKIWKYLESMEDIQ